MRIVYDVSPLALPRTGIGNYHLGALAGLAEAAGTTHEIVAFAPTGPRGLRAIPDALDGLRVERKLIALPLARRWRTAWSRLGRPPLERVLGRFDVFHFSDWMFPPQRGGVRSTVIHDLVPLHFPDWVHPTTRRLHLPKYRNAARTCQVIFVNSDFTRRDVVATLRIPEERVRVAHPGVAAVFNADGERARRPRPYLLALAGGARKNLDVLLRARLLLDGELEVVVAGGDVGRANLGRDVTVLGYVSDAELARLYRGASVFVYPSRFEGFGIPIVEAMASGVPVVASAHPSLDEACGDAAVRADPDDPAAFADAIERALAQRAELVERGIAHARRFSWRRTGEIFLSSYEELVAA